MTYEEVMEYRNKTNAFGKMIGISTTEIRDGYAKAEIFVGKEFINPQGALHGGVAYTLADIAGGSAASGKSGMKVATLDANFHYLRAGLNTTHLTAEAVEIKYGRRAMVYDIKVKDQDDIILAQGIFTYMSLGVSLY